MCEWQSIQLGDFFYSVDWKQEQGHGSLIIVNFISLSGEESISIFKYFTNSPVTIIPSNWGFV